ncbi:MAG: YebC/PmpR family DNA-binding transcriptional regulator [Candidatus Pacebacteria bacterium]|nr:YebC/PmpR family DNA-binding transcriptional regulator [Candidatus Paceibacterota bacterium]MDD3919174.1 YebC/PmpR family DNA-binding transcriptional regulator [Candidatus Paceibacterota bacterium]
MSGHSHWSTIKFKKGREDALRSKVFSKFAKEITVAAKDGGGDLDFNPKLRMIVEKARAENMPSDNIDKAIKKGTGELKGDALEEFLFEAYGPGGVAILIEGITDNMNRTFNEMKLLIAQNGGKLVESGALKWMFERKGLINVKRGEKSDEDVELDLISAEADDISMEDDVFVVETKIEDFDKVRKNIEEMGYKIDSYSLSWIAKEKIDADKEKNYKLFEALDESEDVKDFYYNLND